MSNRDVKLEQVNIVSGDVEASIDFYRRLGVDMPDERVWKTATGIHHASAGDRSGGPPDFDIDSVPFARRWNRGWQGREDLRGRVVIGFRLASRADVDAIYAELTGAGHTALQPPYDAFWGARYAIVEDPDGIAVGLMSPRSAEARSAPPEV